MLSEPLYYFDNKENVDPLTGRLSPSTKTKTSVHHSKATTGAKRRVLGDITERERINRANLETLIDACGMFKKSSCTTPTLIVTPSSRSSGSVGLHVSNENGPVMATVEPSSSIASTTRRQSNNQRQSSASASQKEKSFAKIYR